MADVSADDARRAHSLAHSDGVECIQILALLQRYFLVRADDDIASDSSAENWVALPLERVSVSLDMREELVETVAALLSKGRGGVRVAQKSKRAPVSQYRLRNSAHSGVFGSGGETEWTRLECTMESVLESHIL